MTAATGMGGGTDTALPEVEDDVDVFASFRPLTEGPVFIGLQVCILSLSLSCPFSSRVVTCLFPAGADAYVHVHTLHSFFFTRFVVAGCFVMLVARAGRRRRTFDAASLRTSCFLLSRSTSVCVGLS